MYGFISDILIWFSEQALQAEKNGLDIVCSSPFILQDIQTDSATEINVRMVDGGFKQDRRWSVWVIRWEGEGEFEDELCVWSVVRSVNGGGPGENIAVGRGECRDTWCRRGHEGHKLCL